MTNSIEPRKNTFTGPIRAQALRAFGQDEAESWLKTGWRVFNDRTPLDMARREEDAAQVMRYIDDLTGAEDMLSRAAIPHRDA